MRRLFPLIMVTAVLMTAGLSARAEDHRTITVTGTGEVTLPPDMATVTLGVQTDGVEAAQALDAASEAVLSILARLEVEGVAARDIQTGTLRVQPRYSNSALSSGQQITGYRAVNSVIVQVNDLAGLGGLLAALVGDGANRLDGVAFGLRDPSAAEDEARRRAVAEAIRRATLYADAAGVSLGEVVSISEQASGGYQRLRAEPMMMEAMASAPAYDVPMAEGEIDLTAAITMVFTIAP